MQRLFFALWPDRELAQTLYALGSEARRSCGGRLMRRETLHVTLAFLGAVTAPQRIAAEAAADALGGERFTLDLDRLGYWKHNHIVWAGCNAVPPALRALADGLADGLGRAGFVLDKRPFAVHATLLRRARCAGPLNLDPPIRWAVDEFVLVESQPMPAGARYEVLRRWPLGAVAGSVLGGD